MSQPNDVSDPQMSLWTLQALVAGGASFGGALGAALQQRAPLALGIAAGFVCAVLASLMPILLRRRLLGGAHKIGDEAPTSQRLRVLYIGEWLWIVLAATLAHTLTDTLLGALRE